MKRLFAISTIVCSSLFSLGAQAGQFHDAREKLLAVRTSMIDLLMHKDSRGAAQWKAADEKSVDARKTLAALKAPAGKETPFNEMKTLATAFMDTRDKELREALVAGNEAEAKRLLTVVQKERFVKISELSDLLDK
jgi:hypothetical protein